jgi:hypothetical protein
MNDDFHKNHGTTFEGVDEFEIILIKFIFDEIGNHLSAADRLIHAQGFEHGCIFGVIDSGDCFVDIKADLGNFANHQIFFIGSGDSGNDLGLLNAGVF